MKVAIVGVTGLVGNKISWLLEKRNFQIEEFIPIASDNSKGKKYLFRNNTYNIESIEDLINNHNNKNQKIIIFFASTKEVSRHWIPIILDLNKNAWIIDNSSEYRMKSEIPLVVPEINSSVINTKTRLIANPNCSTAQLVMVLHPLHQIYKIKRIVISTYQSVSGAGYKGSNQLYKERKEQFLNELFSESDSSIFKTKIDLNCIPLCDYLDKETGYTGEELKIEKETPKILDDNNIKITATAVRVPVTGGHSESVNIEFEKDYEIDDIINILKNTDGLCIKEMACPRYVSNEYDVWVSRIRKDYSQKNTINLWIVADNLMKGAALNAVQIAEYIIKEFN